jgi:hypothetical protein
MCIAARAVHATIYVWMSPSKYPISQSGVADGLGILRSYTVTNQHGVTSKEAWIYVNVHAISVAIVNITFGNILLSLLSWRCCEFVPVIQ